MQNNETGGDRREIGELAVISLSTAKVGNGVEQLRDGNLDTYWQSDGPQPHLVNIQFQKKMRITGLAIYCDYKMDESYTPSKISIRAGTHFHDLQEVHEMELEEPTGWVNVNLWSQLPGGERKTLGAYIVQLAVIANHQNGRDTHIRQIHVFGPREPTMRGLRMPRVASHEWLQYATVR